MRSAAASQLKAALSKTVSRTLVMCPCRAMMLNILRINAQGHPMGLEVSRPGEPDLEAQGHRKGVYQRFIVYDQPPEMPA